MSYAPSALQYRPQTFDELLGQDFVVSTLRNAVGAGQIAHAYLFSGPRGVGKTSAARILAKAINCPDGPSASGCEDSELSREIAAGRAADVIEIDGASNTSVNDVRQIRDEVLFAPVAARYKVYIIDEVHMLSNSAFNALLKTIEEPPPHVVFVFATTELHKVPATIRSRCQHFRFRLVSREIITEHLRTLVKARSLHADMDALEWISAESGGSMRDALTLFDQVTALCGGNLRLDPIREALGYAPADRLEELISAIKQGSRAQALAALRVLLEAGAGPAQVVDELARVFRDALISSAESPGSQQSWSEEQHEHALDLCLGWLSRGGAGVDPAVSTELLASRLCGLADWESPGRLVRRLRSLEQAARTTASTSSGPETASEVSPAPSAPPPEAHGAGNAVPDVSGPRTPQAEVTVDQQAAGSAEQAAPEPGRVAQGPLDDELRERIISTLRDRSVTLASAMDNADDWSIQDDILLIGVSNDYLLRLVAKEAQAIRDVARTQISGIRGVKGRMAAGAAEASRPVDESVERVRRVFGGQTEEGEDPE